MTVTITITVSPEGDVAEVRASEVTQEAPPPTLLGPPGEAGEMAAEAAEGPPPLEPEELGLGAAAQTAGHDEGPPPHDVEGVTDEAAAVEAPEPMAVEELE